MPVRKILSKKYLDFLGKRGRSVTGGRRGPIELHHESLFPGYSGSMKKYNDFGALPLLKSEHVERHAKGISWWDSVGLNPAAEALKLLEEYRDTLSEFSFLLLEKGENDYETELELVEEHIGYLQEMLVKLDS